MHFYSIEKVFDYESPKSQLSQGYQRLHFSNLSMTLQAAWRQKRVQGMLKDIKLILTALRDLFIAPNLNPLID